MSLEPPHLTDAEIRDICEGLEQPAAMIRYFRDVLKVRVVHRKPNGMPLVGRDAYRRALGADVAQGQSAQQPNRDRLRSIAGGRA